ncbi:MAG: DMSO reductase [Rhodospirillaceae bacterium]|nr:DMSO reductase [Rhodospirillaceae bacterium]
MHPAPSIIVFTALSGAGYGLLFLLGLGSAGGVLPESPAFGGVAVGLALVMVSAGLVSSTFHLGHPERAWRALSQWRSSWLSREGVAALLTYIPAVALGLLWVLGARGGWTILAGLGTAAGAVVTVFCTSMIYGSLKPVAEWHQPWVPPVYLGFALMTGALWLMLVLALFGQPIGGLGLLATIAILLAWGLKFGSWRHPVAEGRPTPETATGLGAFGTVRMLEPPHTQSNYLLNEMAFRVGRKHAERLRKIAVMVGLGASLILALGAVASGGAGATVAAAGAVVAGMTGVLIERWLFFAEARHTVALYYGEPAAA